MTTSAWLEHATTGSAQPDLCVRRPTLVASAEGVTARRDVGPADTSLTDWVPLA